MQIRTSNKFLIGMLGVLAACSFVLGPLAMFNLYVVPYWVNVVWLDVVTYLHHHGPEDPNEKIPWYRGEVGFSAVFPPVKVLCASAAILKRGSVM